MSRASAAVKPSRKRKKRIEGQGELLFERASAAPVPTGGERASKKAASKSGAAALPDRDPPSGWGPASRPIRRRDPGSARAVAREDKGVAVSRKRSSRRRATAASMAKDQREISVSEFFSKNRHLLGFDNPAKALLTTIKEAVDNSLDACEEAGILPDICVRAEQLAEDRFRVTVQDNGPGILKSQVPRIFGQLLYGSKFHRLRQSRGQQGIGISAAGMYGQLTTGKPVVVTSRVSARTPARRFHVQVDTRRNAPVVTLDEEVEWNGTPHGTRVEIELEATYRKGGRSVDAYIAQTGLANPHLRLEYHPPKGEPVVYERVTDQLPKEPLEIKPHPHGVELGMLMKMLSETKARNVKSFLTSEFSRVSARVAEGILAEAGIREKTSPKKVRKNDVEALFRAIGRARIMAPPTNCLSPIGEELLLAGLRQEVKADFYVARTRSPAVYRGNPFQVEAALAYGGELPADEPITLYRFANRVPLLYQQGACAVTKAVIGTAWRNYKVQQSKGSLPIGPIVLMVHIASVWVPFTSESKEAIAHYPEILKEIKLAIQECGRRLATHIRRGQREREAERKRSYIEKYIPHVGIALREILGLTAAQEERVVATLKDTLERSRKP